ncbi:MAG: diaminopropionate ammonia-lyase [Clostridia bacterium]|nr:diaminopropionate ammonia-lyase [Clostridia bacterium]
MGEYKHIKRKRQIDGTLFPVHEFGLNVAEHANRFHKGFPEYKPTPLRQLDMLAKVLHVNKIYLKDESTCFGLNAFKILGSSYAIAKVISQRIGLGMDYLTYDLLVSDDLKHDLGDVTFATATDGNHGRGVAWMANKMNQKCVVYMPRGTAEERLKNIKQLGADARILDMDYDDCVRYCRNQAEENGWILVQDTAWYGYEDIPRWIMQGYTSMIYEAIQQMNGEDITHVFLQAGVGSFAASIAGFFADLYGDDLRPICVILEPNEADCLFRTASVGDGKLHRTEGTMQTMMAGLCCGEPSLLAWDILADYADHFVTVPDECAVEGMRVLANPYGDDPKVISGESGASTTGLLVKLMTDPKLAEMRDSIGLNKDSKIMLFSTEGATDKVNYMKVITGLKD